MSPFFFSKVFINRKKFVWNSVAGVWTLCESKYENLPDRNQIRNQLDTEFQEGKIRITPYIDQCNAYVEERLVPSLGRFILPAIYDMMDTPHRLAHDPIFREGQIAVAFPSNQKIAAIKFVRTLSIDTRNRILRNLDQRWRSSSWAR